MQRGENTPLFSASSWWRGGEPHRMTSVPLHGLSLILQTTTFSSRTVHVKFIARHTLPPRLASPCHAPPSARTARQGWLWLRGRGGAGTWDVGGVRAGQGRAGRARLNAGRALKVRPAMNTAREKPSMTRPAQPAAHTPYCRPTTFYFLHTGFHTIHTQTRLGVEVRPCEHFHPLPQRPQTRRSACSSIPIRCKSATLSHTSVQSALRHAAPSGSTTMTRRSVIGVDRTCMPRRSVASRVKRFFVQAPWIGHEVTRCF